MTNLTLQVRPDAVAVLTLDQPGSKANVLTAEMWADLEAAVDEAAARTGLRGMVIASAKPGIFIAGADLKLLANAPGPNDPAVRAFIDHGLRVLQKLEALPFPTCAAIDGAALGGGLEVALACDFRVAGSNPKVQLGLPEVTLGLIPGWGGTQRLPRIVGLVDAGEMLASGRADTGPNAAVSGLVDRTVGSDQLVEEAVRTVIGAGTPEEVRGKKRDPLPEIERATAPTAVAGSTAAGEALRVMAEGAALPLAEGIKLETEAFMRLAGSPESKQLIAAFFASRKK
jgi:enoyl-CoA hydratase/carnithine racemase